MHRDIREGRGPETEERVIIRPANSLRKGPERDLRPAEDLKGHVLDCQLALGDVCRMTGNFDDAKSHYLNAITTAKRAEGPISAADAHINIGLSFRGKEELEKRPEKMSGEALAFLSGA